MLDRAIGLMVVAAAACAAAVVAVSAARFALYAFLQADLGPAAAAGIVALAASLITGLYALCVGLRAHERARASKAAQAELIAQFEGGVGHIAERHPAVTLLVTVIGGVLAARHPQLACDFLAVMARLAPQGAAE